MEYKIISDGCCDLDSEVIEKYDLRIVPFYVSLDGITYKKEKEEIEIGEFYDTVINNPNIYPKTSLPSVQTYTDAFLEYINKDIPVICICLTPSLSGSYNSACSAKGIVLEEYPNAKIEVINSECATVSQALFVIEACRMKQAGFSFEKNVEILEKIKATNHVFFTIADFKYLKAGGRISKIAGRAVDILSVKPIITLEKGSIEFSGIVRSRKKALSKTIEKLNEYFSKRGEDPKEYEFAVGYGYDGEEGKEFYREVCENIDKLAGEKNVKLMQIGVTISAHTGPGAIGIGCVKKYENA